LEVVWRIDVDGGRLRIHRHKYVDTTLRALFADVFVDDWSPVLGFPTDYLVEFERAEGGAVSGLRVSGSRVRGVWFERVGS
jgi:hypothetical protein